MPPNEIFTGLKWVGENFGFAGITALILMWIGRSSLKDLTVEMADLSRAVTLAILAMSFAPKGIREQASDIKADIEERQSRRKKP